MIRNLNNSGVGAPAIEDWVGLSWRASDSSLSLKVYVLNSINSSLTALQGFLLSDYYNVLPTLFSSSSKLFKLVNHLVEYHCTEC